MAWLSIGRPAGRSGGHGAGVAPVRTGTPRDVADLAGRNVIAVRLVAEGSVPVAVTELELLLEDCRDRLGSDHPETLVVEGNLAAAQVMAGQVEAGTTLMSVNLARRERVLGDEHAATLTAGDALATAYRLAGRLPEALGLYSRVAPLRNRTLGPSHPHTLVTRLGLGLAFAATGETATALDVLSAAIDDGERAAADGWDAALLGCCLDGLRGARDDLVHSDDEPTGPDDRDDTAAGEGLADLRESATVVPFVPRQRTAADVRADDPAAVTQLLAAVPGRPDRAGTT